MSKMKTNGNEALIQTADDIEDEGAVADDLAQVRKHVGHALHLLAVLSDGQIALREVAKLGIEEQGARLAVVEELGFHSNPSIAGSGVPRGDGGGKIVGDGADDP